MLRIGLSLLCSFLLAVIIMPLVIMLSKKMHVRQTILNYVDNHLSKSGTPTMGGVGIIIALALTCLFFMTKAHSLMLLTLLVTIGYGLIGFIDDFIKIFFKQNKGLSAWQKIIFQLLIATIVAIFAYNSPYIFDEILLPFTNKNFSMGWLAIPFYIGVFIALTNSVNLTDGLDGLASSVTAIYTLFFGVAIIIVIYFYGDGQAYVEEYGNLLIYCAALIGALIGFLCYNSYPAKIFMGDTGSLAIGGGLASLAVVTKLELTIPIIGVMYLLTCLSVMIQVSYYKMTKKRVFLMAPLHHHLERKGLHENRIVTIYSCVTFFMGLGYILITFCII